MTLANQLPPINFDLKLPSEVMPGLLMFRSTKKRCAAVNIIKKMKPVLLIDILA